MTRAELIEVLARGMLEMHRTPGDWDRALEESRQHYREDAERVAPHVVAFVGQWMDGACAVAPTRTGNTEPASKQWKQEMGA